MKLLKTFGLGVIGAVISIVITALCVAVMGASYELCKYIGASEGLSAWVGIFVTLVAIFSTLIYIKDTDG